MNNLRRIPLFLLPIAGVSVLIPSLVVSSLASLSFMIFGGVFTSILLGRNWSRVPGSIKLAHIGVMFVFVGAISEAVLTIVNGETTGYGVDNFLNLIGFSLISIAMFHAARTRHATSGMGDIIDAIAGTTAVASVLLHFGIPAAIDAESSLETFDTFAFMAVITSMIFVMLLMVFGHGHRSVGATWSVVAGLGAATVAGVAVISDAMQLDWRPEVARVFGLGFVLYAVAMSFPGLVELAKPGTREQRYRWLSYVAIAAWLSGFLFLAPTTIGWFLGVIFAGSLIARLRMAQITNRRLTHLSTIHSSLAAELSLTNSVDEAMKVGTKAAEEYLGVDSGVRMISSMTVRGDSQALVSAPQTISSNSMTTQILVQEPLESHEIVGLEQIANVVDFAVSSVDTRAAEITRRARANWLEEFSHDANTGLLNMTDFRALDSLEETCLVMFEIHDANILESTAGSESAEALMSVMATRLAGATRGDDRLWRGDGDRLLVQLAGEVAEPETWADERRQTLSREVFMGAQPLDPTVTAAVLRISDDMRPDSAIVRLSMAMGHAKENGTLATTVEYSEDLEQTVSRRWKIEASFGQALRDPARGGFKVHYQPILDTISGEVVAVEALARWTHPELGDLSPTEFIPAAERIGLVAAIDSYVLNTALADMENLRSIDPKLRVQVNMSPVALTGQRIREAANLVLLHRGRTSDSGVVFELIESALGSGNFEEIHEAMEYCRSLGIELSVDDFGSGESNFDRLARLPFTQVKLANEFVQSEDTILLESMLRTVSDLGMESIVEGVETPEQARVCATAGASGWQGWLYARAQPVDELFDLLLRNREAESAPSSLMGLESK